MKPGFALSLSLEGIALLHRAADGWRLVDDVDLTTPDLPGALEELRLRAAQIDPDRQACKLIIPNDQIRYLSVEATASDEASNRELAIDALALATPYDLDELAYDLSFSADQIQVAAVARETLQEAEQFATDHGFEPVSFVAVPEDHGFDGEPFFGVANRVTDADSIERDSEAVSVIGKVTAAVTPPDTMVSDTEPEELEPVPDLPEAPEPEPDLPEEQEPDLPEEPKPNLPGEPEPDPPKEPAPTPDLPEAPEPEPDLPGEPEPDLPEEPDPDLPVEVTEPAQFVSRRSKPEAPSAAPPLAGASRSIPPAPPPEPVETPAAVRTDAPEEAAAPEPASVADDAADNTDPPPPDPATTPVASAPEKASKPVIIRRQPAAEVPAATEPAAQPKVKPEDEAKRMTVFGARERATVGGKPRHLGLILMFGLLLFLAGVAVWAALFLEDGLAGLFGDEAAETELTALPTPQAPSVQSNAPTSPTAALPETGTDSETERADPEATIDLEPAAPETEDTQQADASDSDAGTGILQRAPAGLDPPEITDLNNLYEVSIDRTDLAQDAVALPSFPQIDTDQPLDAVAAPAAAGTTFALDADGLVKPSREGTLTPEGIRVYLGKPPVVPPATPTRFETEPDEDTFRERLAGLRPNLRPKDLVEQSERTRLGGLTRAELGQLRPKPRPRTKKQEAERDETPTAQAVVVSRVPKLRPRNFSNRVARARKQNTGPSEQVAAATIAPQTVKPKIPSSASVARRATLDNAINLRKINLIGVYGTPANRRALVRLPSGRYKKVKVGDRVDGGRVVAIGDSELRYQKAGRNVTLKMPRG